MMNANQILSFMLFWGAIGCGLFFLLVIVLFRTGVVYKARNKDGSLKDKIPLTGKLAMLIVPLSYFVFQLVSNYFGLVHEGFTTNF